MVQSVVYTWEKPCAGDEEEHGCNALQRYLVIPKQDKHFSALALSVFLHFFCFFGHNLPLSQSRCFPAMCTIVQ